MHGSDVVRRSHAFPDPKAGPWEAEVRFGLVDGRVECIGIDVHPLSTRATEPLTATVLRRVNLGTLIGEVLDDAGPDLQRLAGLRRRYGPTLGEMQAAGIGQLAKRRKKPGPKPKDVAHYQEVARIYLSTPSKPTKAVKNHFLVSESTAGKYVAGARDLGLIPQTTRGRRSGGPVVER
jgi:hypothetical protein